MAPSLLASPPSRSRTQNATGTTVRTFAQVQQLHLRISDTVKAVLIPVLPEAPNTAMVRDKTHAEKKRRQVERYLSRVAARHELRDLPDVVAFLTDQPVHASRRCETFISLS